MDAISRRLLFRIGIYGFCLSLDNLVEIREQVIGLIDYRSQEARSVVGTFSFRQTKIPVLDLAPQLELLPLNSGNALILQGAEGDWALLVDHVDGFCAVSEMTDLQLPHLLQRTGWRCFDRVSLYCGKAYLCLNLAACHDGAPL
ncbi:MAG: chemotaxis protein CheW [Geopsychrobacter sp.]|nr:chemotaxis protein CheW [Geopsychrobacter sp.]